MKIVPELRTNRCVLTEITTNDLSILHEIVEDELFQHYIPELYEVVQTIDGLYQFISSFNTYAHNNEGYLWGIKVTNILIGFVAIMEWSSEPVLFYAMHPNYRSYGYAKECVFEVIKFYNAFSNSHLHTEVFKENKASLSILLSCGFMKVGVKNDKIILRM